MPTWRLAQPAAMAAAMLVGAVTASRAVPKTGDLFPSMTAADLTGQTHHTDEYEGSRTLVVTISDRKAGDAMREWFSAADTKLPGNVARRSIISLHLPFLVTNDYARRHARDEVPSKYWHDTLLDRGDMAERLEQSESSAPYVYALDEHRRILAAVHGTVQSPDALRIWNAFGPDR